MYNLCEKKRQADRPHAFHRSMEPRALALKDELRGHCKVASEYNMIYNCNTRDWRCFCLFTVVGQLRSRGVSFCKWWSLFGLKLAVAS